MHKNQSVVQKNYYTTTIQLLIAYQIYVDYL